MALQYRRSKVSVQWMQQDKEAPWKGMESGCSLRMIGRACVGWSLWCSEQVGYIVHEAGDGFEALGR